MTRAIPSQRKVSEAKITDYLLNERHRIGGAKAAFFAGFGFSQDRWQELVSALLAHPDRNPVETTVRTRYGTKYLVRCRIETPDGRNPCILTVWMEGSEGAATLVTAYPADRSL